jgi:hypothetical protein
MNILRVLSVTIIIFGNNVKIKTFPLSSWIHIYTLYKDKHLKIFLTSLKSVVHKQFEKQISPPYNYIFLLKAPLSKFKT